MNQALLAKAKTAYVLSLETHIKLLTLCAIRHQVTEGTYEDLFAVFHELAEKEQQVTPSKEDAGALVRNLYDEVELLKDMVAKEIRTEKDEGVKNQLIQKYDDLQMTCAKLRSVLEEDEGYEKPDKALTRK